MLAFWQQHFPLAGDSEGFASDAAVPGSLIALPHLRVLQVSGDKAGEFLQGQTTANVNTLTEGQAVPAAFVNLQGRMESNGLLWRDGSSFFYLCDESVAAQQSDALRKFAAFSRTQITLTDIACGLRSVSEAASHTLNDEKLSAAHQASSPSATAATTHDSLRLTIADAEFELLTSLGNRLADAITQSGSTGECIGDRAAFHRWCITHGVFLVNTANADAWLPQALNWDLLGGVSFKKGCYRGQEVVARMHFKGRMKGRLYQVTLSEPLRHYGAPLPLFTAEGRKVGSLLLAEGDKGLAELRHDSAHEVVQTAVSSVRIIESHLLQRPPEGELGTPD